MGRWNSWHQDVTLARPKSYGLEATYLMAAAFLADMNEVEDWGCGGGGFRPWCLCPKYRGVDGSRTPFADEIVDLTSYQGRGVDAILLRHVLEHNYAWEKILANAVRSFRRKLCVVLFTPLGKRETIVVGRTLLEETLVPDLSLPRLDLEDFFSGLSWRSAQASTEHVYMVWRP
jgi:GNAT superfamily N-acetyltransferase